MAKKTKLIRPGAALIVEQWPIERLAPYPRNPRKNDAVVDRMCEAITEFGFRIPIVAKSDGTIVDGHLRYKAAIKLGIKSVPVALADDLTDVQIRAFRLLANQSANWAQWDEQLLKFELEHLKLENYDLNLTGFDDIQLVSFLAHGGRDKDPEETPEPAANPISRHGDIWVLGDHRLMCGDATSKANVDAVLRGARPHLMVTDPPYGVDYDPAWRDESAKKYPSMGNRKDTAKGEVRNDDNADWRAAYANFDGDVIYAWSAGLRSIAAVQALEACNFEVRSQIIWAKNHIAFGRGHYHFQHEPCWYAVRAGASGHWQGARDQSTLWQIDKPMKSETGHSTQKPIECMQRPIENNSRRGDAIYDPFIGSSTTLIACEITGRKCIGIEVDPSYVDIGVRRWQEYAGGTAILESTLQTFDEVAADRLKPKRGRRAAQPLAAE
jgi:DNA modification methylase